MVKKKIYGSVKRFGSRYGRTIRERLSKIESLLKKKYKCPYCKKEGVKRLAVGIWYCKKCGAKFTGKAYTLGSIKKVEEVKNEV